MVPDALQNRKYQKLPLGMGDLNVADSSKALVIIHHYQKGS